MKKRETRSKSLTVRFKPSIYEQLNKLKTDKRKSIPDVIEDIVLKQNIIIREINNVLYFNDNSDYEPVLWKVLSLLTGKELREKDLKFIDEEEAENG